MRTMATAVAITVAACTPSKLADGQVKSAMIDAGLSERNSARVRRSQRDLERFSIILDHIRRS